LRLLDLRGGSADGLDLIALAPHLRGLIVNQVRRLTDVSVIARLTELEMLSLYGLPRVSRLPSLAGLTKLRRLELGQMKSLNDLSSVAAALALEELILIRKLDIGAATVAPLQGHPTLRRFEWLWEDVPASRALPVLAALPLPKPERALRPEEWFKANVSRTE
jgi:hypothetical protein